MPHYTPIILLGDQETVERRDRLDSDAAKQGYTIVDALGFDEGAVVREDDLTEVGAIVAALARAITRRADIWVPYPGPDFVREQHLRRLSLVLQRHGLTLVLYRQLYRVPTRGGSSLIDQALRTEVQAVDDLDHAALAFAGATSLSREIALALGKTPAPAIRRPTDRAEEPEPSMPPTLPPPTVPWTQRKRLVKHYAGWLVHGCGVTQAATARVLNSAGQRTATGAQWKSASVAKLLTGEFDIARG
ncbi:hypothetical protein KV112_06190 [Mycolicibacter sp. MYC123]|uniref:Resolvase n=1 Tax=[Mycobacterium] zoologicum TaxID=2872311 RepID=A0ABU5YHK0_9MYCO|nr:hypothetical protein [Mycolicibacter sp. MYC123]MEB3049335.1 hypothetical protein [Mycolicibacter sp. MYC123]